MKKLTYLVLLSIAGIINSYGQNLVLNGDFEEYVPDSINGSSGNGSLDKATHWQSVGPILFGAADYFNSDMNIPNYSRVPLNDQGYQVPHSGNGYAGFCPYYLSSTPDVREYMNTQLSSPMQANNYYRITLFTSLADSANYAAIFGINLSPTPNYTFNGWLMVVSSSMQLLNPITDKNLWTEISWTYLAQGGEQYLTIGGFTNDQNLNPLTVGGNFPNAYYYIDDVSVVYDATASLNGGNSFSDFVIYPNPVNDVLTLQINDQLSIDQVSVTDELGRKVTTQWTMTGTNTYQLSTSDWEKGLYFVVGSSNGTQRFVKN